jgi:hypothetical protein
VLGTSMALQCLQRIASALISSDIAGTRRRDPVSSGRYRPGSACTARRPHLPTALGISWPVNEEYGRRVGKLHMPHVRVD